MGVLDHAGRTTLAAHSDEIDTHPLRAPQRRLQWL